MYPHFIRITSPGQSSLETKGNPVGICLSPLSKERTRIAALFVADIWRAVYISKAGYADRHLGPTSWWVILKEVTPSPSPPAEPTVRPTSTNIAAISQICLCRATSGGQVSFHSTEQNHRQQNSHSNWSSSHFLPLSVWKTAWKEPC